MLKVIKILLLIVVSMIVEIAIFGTAKQESKVISVSSARG